MKKLFYTIALIPSLLYAQNAKDSITSELSVLVGDSAIVGFAAAIIDQDRILYAKGFGFADVDNQIPYTIQTVQPIASISKTLIGISLLKAQELYMLDLDDDINNYLPFKIVNPHCPESKITIRHLANHSSSIRDTKHYEKSYVFKTRIPKLHKEFPFGMQRWIARRIIKEYNSNREIPLTEFLANIYVPGGKWYSKKSYGKEPPGKVISYSNTGAAIASLVIEHASGMTFIDFIASYILKPLGMQHSGWHLEDFDIQDKSKLYPFYLRIPEYELITLADGGFITSVEDFSKYLAAVMRGYRGEDNILTAESYRRMLKENILRDHGVFWNVQEYGNEKYIGHTGGDPGVNTFAFFDIITNLGYICFTNTNTETGEEIDVALEIMMKYSPWLKKANF